MRNKANKATATNPPPTGAAGATPQTATVLHIQVAKANLAYRGARAAWYAALLAHNGQPAAAYLAACKDNPPSLPKSGVAEAPQGWLSWFVRQGVCALVAGPAQQA